MAKTRVKTRIQPIAQSFKVSDGPGIYITKIGLFFDTIAAVGDFPVEVHIRPVKNGVPHSQIILENSVVYKTASAISTSSDASVETTFTFEEPVYLEGKKEYAIVVQSYGKADEYKVFTSKLGSFKLGSTTERIQQDPYTGVFFKSSNGSTFEPDHLRDLTFKIYRAKFSKSDTKTIRLNASPPADRLLDSDPFLFTASDATLRVRHPHHGFQVNDTVTISADSSGLTSSTSINGVTGADILGTRTITAVDWTGYEFEMDATATASLQGGGGGILATEQFILNSFKPNIEINNPLSSTYEIIGNLTTSKSYAGDETAYGETSDVLIKNKKTLSLGAPHVIASEARDTALGRSSFYVDVGLATAYTTVAPTLDLQRASMIAVQNIIDKQDASATDGYNVPINYVAETDARFGSAAAKHITVPFTIAEPATGIKVIVDVNRPSTSDFDIYYRTLEAGADVSIDTIDWTAASKIEPASNHNSNPTDERRKTFREYRYTIGGDYIGGLRPFTTYQIKLVMHSTSSSYIPRFKNLRTIALGT